MTHPPIDQQVTFLYTRDLATTANFYENVMKLSLVLDQGSCRIYRVTQDGFLGFCDRIEAPQQPVGVLFTIVTSAVDEWYEYLKEQRVYVEKSPTLNPEFNIYHCFVRDPNNYLIEIQQFLDPNWSAASSSA